MYRGLIKMAVDITTKAVNIDMPECKFCYSKAVVKNGKRNGIQYYICKECGRGFVYNKALPKMKYPMDIIAKGVYDYYAGISLNKIREGIQQQWGLTPSDSSIYGWVKKLTKIGLSEAKKHTPNVSDKWIADETVIRLKGTKYWLINVIDFDTRFLLVSKLSKTRTTRDIASALEKASNRAGKNPKILLTDGWRAYEEASEQLYGSDCKHIKTTPFEKKELSTNIVERWHGTLKDRLKPMRGMDKSETYQLILEGFILYYNFFRPHESLNGRTPAEKAKLKYPYKNWKDVIETLRPKVNPTIEKIRTIEDAKYPFKPYRKRSKPKDKKRINQRSKKPEYPEATTLR